VGRQAQRQEWLGAGGRHGSGEDWQREAERRRVKLLAECLAGAALDKAYECKHDTDTGSGCGRAAIQKPDDDSAAYIMPQSRKHVDEGVGKGVPIRGDGWAPGIDSRQSRRARRNQSGRGDSAHTRSCELGARS
jgi:hypothetical protein